MDSKWDIINQYKNMINVKYWGIQCRITNLINEERQHKQLGGDLKKITIDNNDIKYNIVYNNNPNDLNIQLLTIDGSLQCGIILFDKDNKTEAIFQDVHAYDNCYQSTVENTSHGKMIVKLMIEICKKKNIKKILLSDNSIKKIDGLNHLKQLSCLYLQENCIEKIENLEGLDFTPEEAAELEALHSKYLKYKNKYLSLKNSKQ